MIIVVSNVVVIVVITTTTTTTHLPLITCDICPLSAPGAMDACRPPPAPSAAIDCWVVSCRLDPCTGGDSPPPPSAIPPPSRGETLSTRCRGPTGDLGEERPEEGGSVVCGPKGGGGREESVSITRDEE
jgi:hypothetical protein